jgi:hypothetical protein
VTAQPPKALWGAEQDEQAVYDFLYHDAPRIKSFLSQFDSSGALTQVIQERETSKTTGRELGAAAELDAQVVKGGGNYRRSASGEARKAGQWTYDPVWANALTLLEYLDEEDMLVRDISVARMGQFTMVSGALQVMDLGLVRKMLDIPALRKLSAHSSKTEGNRHERLAARAKGQTADNSVQVDLMFDLLRVMPHTIQATISTQEQRTWCTLKDDCVTIPASELFLKHGTTIPGTWHIVGIADARPDTRYQNLASGDEIGAGILQTGFSAMVSALVPIARMLLGRPAECYGVTPLLIFRHAEPR